MNFDEILTQVVELLQRQGRVSYGALKRRFDLDDDYLHDIQTELIDAQRIAADEGGKVLVWIRPSAVSSLQFQVSGSFPPTSDSRPLTPDPQFSDAERRTLDPGQSDGERRQLTVMFCELGRTPSTEEQPDPEEWREALLVAQRTCEEIIGRYEGYLAQSLGDGLIIYWGYPRAHEDDARRAVQAGLEIVRAVQRLDYWPIAAVSSVQVRVGIHTGPVIFGATGEQSRREPLALGPTPHIAVHLLAMAEPNTVVLGAATYHLVAGYFICRPLGRQVLQDQAKPIDSYLVLSESGARHRLEAATMAGLTPFIGREEESNLLRKHWEQVQEGRGQVILVSGEAGIGKSRLIQELKEQLMREPSICIETRCSPYYRQSAFYPVIDYIQRSLQFGREETQEAKRQKLERVLARAHLEDAAPLFANLLSLPFSLGVYANLAPQRQREKLLHVIVSWFLSLTRHKPVLTMWEDLHWSDPSTLALLQLLTEQLPTSRILAVFTFRPEFTLPWPPRSHVTSLMLGRLGFRHAETMVGNVAKGKTLPHEVKEQIVNKTDGVPLFVEELTKMVLESGLMKEQGGAYHLVGPLPPLAIPTTLQDSLFARLDGLAAAREVAQVGAVLGREFAPEVLHAVVGGDEQALQLALEKLVAAEVLYRRGVTPRARYVFKHALIQDAAYQSLLTGKRQQYHQQIARILEERFPDTKETQPELIAHHYTEAGVATHAVTAWQKAGQKAIEQSAFVEATEHLHKGLAVLKTLPETPARDQQELHLYALLGPALMTLNGYSAPDVEKIYAQALALCHRVGETPRRFQVLLGLAIFYLTSGELQTARQLGEQCLSLAQQEDNPSRLLQARVVLANVLFYQGDFLRAQEHLLQGMALQNGALLLSPPRTLRDPGVNALPSLLAWTLWCLGYADRAVQKSEEALALADRSGRPLSQVIAGVFMCGARTLRREKSAALPHAEQAVILATEQGFSLWAAYGVILRGWALGQQANQEEGIAQMQQGLATLRAMGAELVQSWFLLMLAEAYGKDGKAAEGLAIIAQAFAGVQKRGEQAFAAELYRLRGELTLAQSRVQSLESRVQENQKPVLSLVEGAKDKSQKPVLSLVEGSENTDPRSLPPDHQGEAEGYFLKAIEIARQQQAKSWELRATMSLCRLWQKQGKESEAQKLLAESYSWFTEGFDTLDLQEARGLLEELSH